MTDALPATRNAFELLSKPTLDLTPEDIRDIAADLRAKRERFLQGIADKPVRAVPKPVLSAEEIAARTASLDLDL